MAKVDFGRSLMCIPATQSPLFFSPFKSLVAAFLAASLAASVKPSCEGGACGGWGLGGGRPGGGDDDTTIVKHFLRRLRQSRKGDGQCDESNGILEQQALHGNPL